MDTFTRNVPCGVYQCLNDPYFTLLNMNDGFLDLTGYTKAEISARFQNRFLEIMHPEDRNNTLQAAQEQLQKSDMVEFDYRIIRKDGTIVWVLDRGSVKTEEDGVQTFYCVLLDITDRKKDQEELRRNLERYKVVMNQAADIIFEWDMAQDLLSLSPNWQKKFGYEGIDSDISTQRICSVIIHPDDTVVFLKLKEDSILGLPYSEAEVRLRNGDGHYTWCRIRATTQYDENGHPIKSIGIVTDIDAEKKHEQELVEWAQTDGLTGLLNKQAIQLKIESFLKGYGAYGFHALLMVDMDHFKKINDHYGHLSGDVALSDVAALLKRMFRSSDMIGRIGGDEFLIFAPDMESREIVDKKLKELFQMFSELVIWKETDVHLSVSIGAAIFPDDGQNFLELYRCADKALYDVKNSGRGSFAFYDLSRSVASVSQGGIVSAVREKIDSEIGSLNKTLDRYTFRMLYNAVNIEFAINQILEIIGRAYDISRVYIIEKERDGMSFSNTFEWCNNGIPPQMHKMQRMRYSDELKGCHSMFNELDIYYCPDVKTMEFPMQALYDRSGACSTLQCAMKEAGVIYGSIGFDFCEKKRRLSVEQIDSFSLITAVIATFLLRMRMKERIMLSKDKLL